MVYLTYVHSSHLKGVYKFISSFSIFQEIFVCFLLKEILRDTKINIIYHDSWQYTRVLSKETFEKFCSEPLVSYDSIININNFRKFNSLSFDDFNKVKNTIINASKNSLINLSNVCLINPSFIYKWYLENKFEKDYYSLYIIPKMQELYFTNQKKLSKNTICIHLRLGDLQSVTYNFGFNCDFLENLINLINKYFNYDINIIYETNDKNTSNMSNCHLSERNNFNYNWCEEINKLKNIKNVNLFPGNIDNINEHINLLCNSKILFLTMGSFGYYSGLISNAKVFVHDNVFKKEKNMYGNVNILPNFVIYKNLEEIENNIKKFKL